jgi:hypothetical protein
MSASAASAASAATISVPPEKIPINLEFEDYNEAFYHLFAYPSIPLTWKEIGVKIEPSWPKEQQREWYAVRDELRSAANTDTEEINLELLKELHLKYLTHCFVEATPEYVNDSLKKFLKKFISKRSDGVHFLGWEVIDPVPGKPYAKKFTGKPTPKLAQFYKYFIEPFMSFGAKLEVTEEMLRPEDIFKGKNIDGNPYISKPGSEAMLLRKMLLEIIDAKKRTKSRRIAAASRADQLGWFKISNYATGTAGAAAAGASMKGGRRRRKTRRHRVKKYSFRSKK